jgi:hypothetical protein
MKKQLKNIICASIILSLLFVVSVSHVSAALETAAMATQRKNEAAKNALTWGVQATKQASKCAIGFGSKLAIGALTGLIASLISPEVSVKDYSAQAATALQDCISSVAIGLAKDQIVKITKSTMTWINSGLGGNPLYAPDINNIVNQVEDSIISTELATFRDSQYAEMYPYGRDFASAQIQTQRSADDHLSGLQSSLFDALTIDDQGLDAADKLNSYAHNFSQGGWNGWLSLTQNPQNNPLGFNMLATDQLAYQKEVAITNKKEEIARGGGVQDKKECVQYGITKKAATDTTAVNQKFGSLAAQNQSVAELETATNTLNQAKLNYDYLAKQPQTETTAITLAGLKKDMADAQTDYDAALNKVDKTEKAYGYTHNDKGEECTQYETVTPGSVIKDQISRVVTSPVVQLELVRTLDDALGAVLDGLMGKLQDSGLKNIDEIFNTETSSVPGMSLNSSGELIMGDATSNGSSNTGGFDLKDLSNKYREVGMGNGNYLLNKKDNWIPGGNNTVRNGVYLPGGNYTKNGDVYTQVLWGKGNYSHLPYTYTKVADGLGDYVLDKEGVLQIQDDYTTKASQNLERFKDIMPALGELDYCIPGPNPNWEQNSQDVYMDLQTRSQQKENSSTFADCNDGFIFKGWFEGTACNDTIDTRDADNKRINMELQTTPYILSLYNSYKNMINSEYGPNGPMLDNNSNGCINGGTNPPTCDQGTTSTTTKEVCANGADINYGSDCLYLDANTCINGKNPKNYCRSGTGTINALQ